MTRTIAARPASKPVRAVALCNDEEVTNDGADAAVGAEARRLAGIDLRKRTVASTMVYAGTGRRASERAKAAEPKKPSVKKTAPRQPQMQTPAAKPDAEPPERHGSELPLVPVDAVETAARRKRLRTHSQFILRIADTIAGQLDAIDAITRDPSRGESGSGEAERHARTVAALARVSAELRKEQEADRRRRADDHDGARDPGRSSELDPPRDLDELRERLSRRLDERLRRGSPVSVGDDAARGS